jgi:hypothetical protein
MEQLTTHCELCGKELKYQKTNKLAEQQGSNTAEGINDKAAKSEAHLCHLAPKTARKEFKDIKPEQWEQMGVTDPKATKICCYECHEVVLHNPIFNEEQFFKLCKLFNGKNDLIEKMVILNRIIEAGLNNYNPTKE